MWRDVHVMVFVGFGFLMTFLREFTWSSVGLNFLVAGFTMQLGMIVVPFLHRIFENEWERKIQMDISNLVTGDFCAAAILISMGAVLGRTSPMQLLTMAIVETFAYALNEAILVSEVEVTDIGGSMVIHAFGAYFGVACAWVLGPRGADQTNNGSNRWSDTFAMIGTTYTRMRACDAFWFCCLLGSISLLLFFTKNKTYTQRARGACRHTHTHTDTHTHRHTQTHTHTHTRTHTHTHTLSLPLPACSSLFPLHMATEPMNEIEAENFDKEEVTNVGKEYCFIRDFAKKGQLVFPLWFHRGDHVVPGPCFPKGFIEHPFQEVLDCASYRHYLANFPRMLEALLPALANGAVDETLKQQWTDACETFKQHLYQVEQSTSVCQKRREVEREMHTRATQLLTKLLHIAHLHSRSWPVVMPTGQGCLGVRVQGPSKTRRRGAQV